MENRFKVENHESDFDGSMQMRYNSSASAMELHLFCIKPSIYYSMSERGILCVDFLSWGDFESIVMHNLNQWWLERLGVGSSFVCEIRIAL